MSDDKVKRLNLMRFWLFGTFVIVWAATFAFTYLWTAPISASVMDVVMIALPVWIITAVLAVLLYVGYKWWLTRDENEIASEPSAPAPSETPSFSQSSEGGSEG